MNTEAIWNKDIIGYGIQLISYAVVLLSVWLTQRSMDKRAKNDNNSRLEQMKIQINENKNQNVLEHKLKKAEELYEVLQDTRGIIIKFIKENDLKEIEKSELYTEFYKGCEDLMHEFSIRRMRLELLVNIYFPNLKGVLSLVQYSEKNIKPLWSDEALNSTSGLDFCIKGLHSLLHRLNITMDHLLEQVNVTEMDSRNNIT
ncbi:TPA: hypothetical protein ACX3IO_004544 [Vibrio parahaemolyticus]